MSEEPVSKRRNWRRRRRPGSEIVHENSISSSAPILEKAPKVEGKLVARKAVHVKAASESSGDLVEKLIGDLQKGYECMVCMSAIRYSSPIWTCRTCWAMFHLGCVHQWIKRNSPSTGVSRTAWEWRCPGCQYVYVESRLPVYKCFCGSVDTPPSSRQFTAHSCGESCRRPRLNCDHPCTLTCHPGPCPPCQSLLPPAACYSGHPGGGAYVRCGEALPYSCGKECGKLLACGLHVCVKICHQGSCPRCTAVAGMGRCRCGRSEQSRFCSDTGEIICKEKCGKNFPCKVHICESVCHWGSCGPCPFSAETCHCGRMRTVRKHCSDPIPSCYNTCGKIQDNCQHPCVAICHSGPCPPCQVQCQFSCRCGKTKQSFACSQKLPEDPILCQQVCRALKSCSKHRCANLCCANSFEDHLCLQICRKKLSCGKHLCDDICHLGKCAPCRVVSREPVSCGCGKKVLLPPLTCGTPPPLCHAQCGRPHTVCGHPCPSKCHTGGCGLCLVLGPKICAGSHETLAGIPCHVQSVSCGRKCGKPLPCKVHLCLQNCHEGPCAGCTQNCVGVRRTDCGHLCGAFCGHEGECPRGPCDARVRVACPCGLHTEEFACQTSEKLVACSAECALAARAAKLRLAFRSDVELGPDSEMYSGELVAAAERFAKYITLIDGILFDAVEQRTKVVHLSPTCGARRWLALEYAQIHYRFDATVLPPDFHISLSFVPNQTRVPTPSLTALLEMSPSQALPFTVDFFNDGNGPQIHLYDVAKGFGRLTTEKIFKLLNPLMRGAFRTRRGERTDLFLDFVDPNKAVSAFRRMKETPGLDACTLVNVTLFTKNVTDVNSLTS